MAVVITTKFYEEDTPAWHDLSKIVFTSPNIVSPNTAGTRSHILPGQGDLALWYEDSANMYEIEPIQDTYDTSFYYCHFDVASDIDLDTNPTSALITAGNYSQFVIFIKRELDVEITGFVSVNSDIIEETLKLEYTMMTDSPLDYIYFTNTITDGEEYETRTCIIQDYGWFYDKTRKTESVSTKLGWNASVISDLIECHVDFTFSEPTNITYIKMVARSVATTTWEHKCDTYEYNDTEVTNTIYYFIGNFKIQGKTAIVGASWVDLYTGSNTSNIEKDIFMTDNIEYYTYYRILIIDNTSLTTPSSTNSVWDSDYYAISGLTFYGNEYSSDPGTGHTTLYSFDDDISKRELHVVNAIPVSGGPINTIHDANTNVEGTINISTTDNGGILTTSYLVTVDENGGSIDYLTQAAGDSVSPVISGTTGATGTTGTTTVVEDMGITTNGYIDVTGETKIENGYIYSNLSGQQLGITYSDNEYDITTDITYTTVISGAVASGTIGDVAVTGYTNRYEDRDSALRSEFYSVSLTDSVGTGIISTGTTLYLWEQKTDLGDVEFSTHDSVVFEVTQGEAYDCRLTAWDDVTHSTTVNHLIAGDYVRVSALAFRSKGTVLAPEFSLLPDNYIASPIYNRIFKGNVVYNGTNYYYGDFNLSHRTEPDMIGDYLIFKPMLYEIDDTIPYGIHDHVIVLHYTYT